MDRLQSDTATIADSVKEWLILLENQNLNKMPYLPILEKRFSQCVTPAHFLAYMLHPKYNGNGLTVDQREKARVWVTEDISNEFLPFIIQFEIQSDVYPKSYFEESMLNMSPIDWWHSLEKNSNLPKKFLRFTSHLFRCVASSAGIERIFSNFSLIQSKLRNKLGLEKAGKLVSCYKMLNCMANEKNNHDGNE